MQVTPEAVGLLLAAGVLAGVLGTAGGITSLVSYPALLLAGVPPLRADVVNLVAFAACWPGSALASRTELAGSRATLVRLLPLAAAGAAAGSGLLLVTPPDAFERIVPLLVLAGSAALLAQPRLTRRFAGRSERGGPALGAGVALLSVYGGYFGAGSGVMLLVLALVLLDRRLPRANAVKNMLNGASAVASAGLFALAGPVDWRAVVPLAAGLLVGSTLGPRVARRLPERIVRWGVALLGIGLAVELWLTAG